jgi:hypothetical protein
MDELEFFRLGMNHGEWSTKLSASEWLSLAEEISVRLLFHHNRLISLNSLSWIFVVDWARLLCTSLLS